MRRERGYCKIAWRQTGSPSTDSFKVCVDLLTYYCYCCCWCCCCCYCCCCYCVIVFVDKQPQSFIVWFICSNYCCSCSCSCCCFVVLLSCCRPTDPSRTWFYLLQLILLLTNIQIGLFFGLLEFLLLKKEFKVYLVDLIKYLL